MQLLKLEEVIPILLAAVPNAVVFTMNPAVAYKDTFNDARWLQTPSSEAHQEGPLCDKNLAGLAKRDSHVCNLQLDKKAEWGLTLRPLTLLLAPGSELLAASLARHQRRVPLVKS